MVYLLNHSGIPDGGVQNVESYCKISKSPSHRKSESIRDFSKGKMVRTFELSREERSRVLERISKQLSRNREILFAYAYGSFLEDCPFRDLDLAVFLRPKRLLIQPFRYEDALAAALTRQLKLSFPIDARILNSAPVSFRYRVLQGRLLFEKDPEARIEIVVHTVARYLDLRPFLHHYLKDAYGCET